jgi:hypothetical protein
MKFGMRIFLLLVVFVCGGNLMAQKMFEQELEICPLKFELEDEQPYIFYEPNDSVLITDFLSSFEEKQQEKIKGVIMFQIMIDTGYNVCMLSYTNKSTVSDRKLDLVSRIKSLPGWKRVAPDKAEANISALLSFGFDHKELTVIRTGYNRNRGRKILESTTYQRFADTVAIDTIIVPVD